MNANAVRIYAALALRAAGRAIDGRSLGEVEALLGLPDDPEGVQALLYLVAQMGSAEKPKGAEDAASLAPRAASSESGGQTVEAPASRTGTVQADWEEPLDLPPEIDGAWYVYGVVEGSPVEGRELVGIEGIALEEVWSQGIAAIGHPCPATPYESTSDEIVINWVKEHDAVLKQALETYATVVPCKFNTLIKGDDGPAAPAVRDWLERNYEDLCLRMAKVRGRREYGVRVLWDPEAARAQLLQERMAKFRDDEDDAPAGVRYLHQEQERRVLSEMYLEARAALRARSLSVIDPLVEGLMEEQRDASDVSDATVLRCACLVSEEQSSLFTRALERLQVSERITVQVSGPWPAYNFVTQPVAGGDADR